VEHVRRLVAVCLITVCAFGVVACGEPSFSGADKFKGAKVVAPIGTTTTTRPPPTTTIPPTTTTMSPIMRLALSRAFLESIVPGKEARERCRQLLGGTRRRVRC
jgi:hypothetical protein